MTSNSSYYLIQIVQNLNWPQETWTGGLGVEMLRYAARHNLAVLTWSTPGNWNSRVSFDQLTGRDDRRHFDEMFDVYAKSWDEGVNLLVDKYKLPSKDYLLYGLSRGAQWAHRLALRKSERFFGD